MSTAYFSHDWDENDQEFEDSIVMDFIEEQLLEPQQQEPVPSCHTKRRNIYERVKSFQETPWGQLLEHPDCAKPKSALGKRFRRRFRLPLSI